MDPKPQGNTRENEKAGKLLKETSKTDTDKLKVYADIKISSEQYLLTSFGQNTEKNRKPSDMKKKKIVTSSTQIIKIENTTL